MGRDKLYKSDVLPIYINEINGFALKKSLIISSINFLLFRTQIRTLSYADKTDTHRFFMINTDVHRLTSLIQIPPMIVIGAFEEAIRFYKLINCISDLSELPVLSRQAELVFELHRGFLNKLKFKNRIDHPYGTV